MQNDGKDNNTIDNERIEDKFIVPKDKLIEVKQKVETYLPPYTPDPETIYTINTSIYFDSPDLTFLKQHLNNVDDRRKIRIRCYAPNGTPNHIYFIEVKSKSDEKCIKTRVQLSEQGFQYVMKHYQIMTDEDLFTTNIDLDRDEVEQHCRLINYLLLINKATPVCHIEYRRYAFQKSEEFRVTMDSQIQVKPLRMIKMSAIQDLQNQDIWNELKDYKNKFSNAEDFVLEVKYEKGYEPWFQKMVDDLDVKKQGFSKYVWAMASVIDSTMNMIKR